MFFPKPFVALLLLFITLTFVAGAQTEIVKYATDGEYNLFATNHITDTDGSIYVLAVKDVYYPGPGILTDGGNMGFCVLKLDSSGNTLWTKQILWNGRTQQIFINGNMLFVPYATTGGCREKGGRSLVWAPAFSSTSLDFGILLNKNDGIVIKNTCFYNSGTYDISKPYYLADTCPNDLFLKAFLHNDQSITYFNYHTLEYDRRPIENHPNGSTAKRLKIISSEERNDTFGYLGSGVGTTSNCHYNECLVFDQFADQYIVEDSGGISVYKKDWSLFRKIVLPVVKRDGSLFFNIACNEKYYVINYGTPPNSQNEWNFTAIYTKDGERISVHESPYYDVINISADNIIYGIPHKMRDRHSTDDDAGPMVLTKMDIQQNILSEKSIGKPYVKAKCMTFNTNKEIIITGTTETCGLDNEMRHCSGIYYYRNRLDNL